MNLLSVEKF